MKRAVILSIFDQGMISAFSLVLNLAFIAHASPAEFGRFVLVQAIAFFALSAQNALVIMPLNYLLPGRPTEEANRQLSMLTSANLCLMAASLLLGLVFAFAIGADPTLALVIVAYFVVMLAREYARNVLIVGDRMAGALAYDVAAIMASALLVMLAWQWLPPVIAALSGVAAANALILLIGRIDLRWSAGNFPAHLRSYAVVWRETRWALQGALQNEVEARSYVLMLEGWRGAAALGTLQAGRTVMSPLLLIAPSWRRIARPRLVEHFEHGRTDAALKVLAAGALIITCASVVYALVLAFAWPMFETYIFTGRYSDMQPIVWSWWLYALVVGLAGVATTMLEARRQFRTLAAIGFGVAALVVLLMAGLISNGFDVQTVVLALTGVHGLELIALGLLIVRQFIGRSSAQAAAEGRS